MREEQKEQLRQKWEEWLEKIGEDLGDLLFSQDIFNEVCEIVKNNSNIQTPSAFFGWIRDNYVDSIIIRIGRLSDHDNRTISLHRLIIEISENPDVITREYFVSQWRDDFLREMGTADRTFDMYANFGKQLVDPERLDTDIRRLDEGTSLVKDFRDQWVAHFDEKRKTDQMPTFGDLNKALDIIDEVWCKYRLLLGRSAPDTRKPAMALDWEAPLRHRWIKSPEQ